MLHPRHQTIFFNLELLLGALCYPDDPYGFCFEPNSLCVYEGGGEEYFMCECASGYKELNSHCVSSKWK